ncbi:Oidioi.mRNA.OKI2018_I69.chr1.g1112.t1.cds [Oikopleura dioica]|uniref:Oidioi.mRNA.OKI2018_I69.chr1.g1112.t1.cds n=1 Tax=Oikopleura dioica TaxID=34765 RepID=A0ABN7SLX1_OIKDI|nr:Oidioi.mRNA.OKI2018_I69.chr1.g1112.t1.cds [Oikopleura dioica]
MIKAILSYYKLFLFVFLPLLLLPLALVLEGEEDGIDFRKLGQFSYMLVIVASFWIFDVLPLAVTALIPYIILPSFGMISSSIIASKYMSNVNFLLMGGFMLAIAIEESNLHKRIALGTLMHIGSNPRALMFGFMLVTWLLSMCITNTSTTALMIPIVISVLEQLKETQKGEISEEADKEAGDSHEDKEEKITGFDKISLDSTCSETLPSEKPTRLEIYLLLCVPFSANIGGLATLTGTDLNVYLAGYYREFYEEYADVDGNDYFDLTYANWAKYSMVQSLTVFLLSFFWLQGLGFGWNPKDWLNCKNSPEANQVIRDEYKKLGPMKQAEYLSLICFVTTVILWISRDPSEDASGWAELFPVPNWMTDGMAVIIIAIFLFILPKGKSGLFCMFSKNIKIEDGPAEGILNWEIVQRKCAWGVLILMGGGFAIALASDESGFSEFIANGLAKITDGWDAWAICLLCSVIAALFTEITSNTAANALFMPLLNKLALKICIHPLYLMIPSCMACSLSFMLPAATAPNAIAFGNGKLKTTNSALAGFMPKILGILVLNTFVIFFGPLVYKTDNFPCFGIPYAPELVFVISSSAEKIKSHQKYPSDVQDDVLFQGLQMGIHRDNYSCPDYDLGSLCDTDCRVDYIGCRQECSEIVCENECVIIYGECLSDCPCGVNCPIGCENCPHPLCVPSPCDDLENNLDFQRCKNINQNELNWCIDDCKNSQYDCYEICTDKFLASMKNCPCYEGCPQGCPFCSDYQCEGDGFVVINQIRSYQLSLDGDSYSREFLYPTEDSSYVYQAAHAFFQGNFYIFGGQSDTKKIAVLNGCAFEELSTRLTYSHSWGNSAVVLPNSSKVLLCFSQELDYKGCMNFDGTSVGVESYRTSHLHFMGCVGNYRSTILAVGSNHSDGQGKYVDIRDANSGSWSTTTNFPYEGYTEANFCLGVEDAMLSIGGYSVTTAVYMYRDARWTNLGSMNNDHYMSPSIMFNNEIYSVGRYAVEKFQIDVSNNVMTTPTIFYEGSGSDEPGSLLFESIYNSCT